LESLGAPGRFHAGGMIMVDNPKIPPKLPADIGSHKEAKFLPPEAAGKKEAAQAGIAQPAREALAPEAQEIKNDPRLPESIEIDEYYLQDKATQWRLLVEAFNLNRRMLLSLPGVTAVDIGYRTEAGKFLDELAVRVHVERKLPDEYFINRKYDYFPKHKDLRDKKKKFIRLKTYNVPTDVIEGDYRPAQHPPRPGMVLEKPKDPDVVNVNPRRRLNPLVGGISIGSPRAPSGTLGALVWDNKDGSVCILSNWHILSGDLRVEAGTPCIQPGRLDQGRSTDVVARLKRWSFDRRTDAALAELTGSRHYCTGEILGLPQQILGTTDPHLGMLVQKCGRSTGFTWGFVDGLYFSTAIEYSNGIVQVFEDQIHIAPVKPGDRMSEPGDSGALWLTGPTQEVYEVDEVEEKPYHVVGLHFAGDLPHSAFGEYALANPISIVMENLDFSFRPRFLEIRDEDVLVPPPLPMTEDDGADAQPIGIVDGRRFRGSGGHGDQIPVRSTGTPGSG